MSYSISWHDQAGLTEAARVEGADISDGGIGFKSSVELRPGVAVFVQGHDGRPKGCSVVRQCTRRDAGYVVGLEFDDETRKTLKPSADGDVD